MGAVSTVAEARAEALRVLAGVETHAAHVTGVAAAAERLAPVVPVEDVDLLVLAAWLHDIGYAPELAITGFHPLDGARYLRAFGANERLRRLVANHTNAWVEAEARGLAGVLAEEFPREVSPTADALTYADLTTGPAGERVSVEERLAEIFVRYEAGDVVHESIRRAAPELMELAAQVEMRRSATRGRSVSTPGQVRRMRHGALIGKTDTGHVVARDDDPRSHTVRG